MRLPDTAHALEAPPELIYPEASPEDGRICKAGKRSGEKIGEHLVRLGRNGLFPAGINRDTASVVGDFHGSVRLYRKAVPTSVGDICRPGRKPLGAVRLGIGRPQVVDGLTHAS